MDGIGTSICGTGSLPHMDTFTLSAFDGLDSYTDLGAGTSVDDNGLSALYSSLNSEEQAEAKGSPDGLISCSNMHLSTTTLPKSIHRAAITLPERMLKALAMLKEASSGSGAILAQVWMPMRDGERQVLTTSEQPFLLDQRLTGYREASRQFTFSATEGPGQFPGLPGRVYMSRMPEWTSNVMYYHDSEYLRVDHAARYEVRGSLAVPVLDSSGPSDSCCAVLEVVMTQEKDNFLSEIDNISKALQSVHLSTVKATYPQNLTSNQESALMEISYVLRTVCHAHMLPLALVWVPFCWSSNANVSVEYGDQDIKFSLRKNDLICIQESFCYVNDMRMNYFVHACAEHPLKRGQGVAGNAILSNSPFFSFDVRDYDMCDYPLAHHARKFGLQAAVAIRLRSTYTGCDDYVLEYFLPPLCKGCDKQQRLLDDISETMQRVCKSLRTVSDSEMMAETTVNPSKEKGCGMSCSSSGVSVNSSHKLSVSSTMETDALPGHQMVNANKLLGELKHAINKLKPSTTSHGEKRRTSMEKNISFSILQKYFAGSLKDAAKNLGVCPTTLKRICRQHGIQRWPSRKIKKVNRSLEKIQNVISSVHGVDREVKYDPATGFLISSADPSGNSLPIDVEGDGAECGASQGEYQGQQVLEAQKEKLSEIDFNLNGARWFQNSHSAGTSDRSLPAELNNVSHFLNENATSFQTGLGIVGNQDIDASRDLFLVPQQSKIGTETLPSPSSITVTDYSSGSASSHGTFKKCSKAQASPNECSTTATVKANYKDDAVRFKLLPSMKHHDLLEEIAKRLKLSVGTFHLKYRDDEDEWVILENDADLQECLDILETTRSHVLKVQVRDVPYPAASPGSSSVLGT